MSRIATIDMDVAHTNKYLAQRNKFCAEDETTKAAEEPRVPQTSRGVE